MKRIYISILFSFISFLAFSQLPNGSTAPNWTLTDMNGTSHTLYSVLDQNIPVIIDFSATWCGPCWNYHQTHALDNLYDQYGPNGTIEPNKAMVYWIESDDATNDPCMTASAGCTGGTQGNWLLNSNLPYFNPPNEAVPSSYQIGAYPTILAVCPNRRLYEVGQANLSTLVSWMTVSCALDENTIISDETCFNDGTGGIDLEIIAGFGNKTYSWSNGATTQDLIGVPQGTYECTITEGRGHKIFTGPIQVSGPTSGVEISTTNYNDVLCNGENNGAISVSASGGAGSATYMWSNGATSASINSLTPGTYSVVATDLDGCTSQESYTILEPEILTESVSVIDETCDNSNGVIVLQAIGGTGPFLYDIGVDLNNTGIFSNVPSGFYNSTITDINGCSVSAPLIVQNIPGPEAVALALESLSCENNQVTLSGEGSSEGPLMLYNWTTSNGNIVSGANTLNPVVDAAGTYTLIVTDAQTICTESTSVEVVGDFAAPTSIAGDPQSLDCQNVVATLDGSASSSGSNYTYLWTTANGNITDGETTAIATVNAAGVYTLIVTNTLNGCSSNSSVTIDQSAEVPTVDAGDPQALTCTALEVALDGSNSSSGSNFTYTWSTDEGSIVSGGDSPTPTVNAPGIYLLEVTNLDNGCAAFSSVTVSLDNLSPDGFINDPATLTCTLTEQNLNLILDEGNYSFVWSTLDGNILEGENNEDPLINEPGLYLVNIVNLDNGCEGSAEVTIDEFINSPQADFNFVADKKQFEFTNNSIGSPTTYLWDFGDSNTSTDENPIHTYAENGDYTVCLTITNECGDNTICNDVKVSIGSSLLFSQEVVNTQCAASCDGNAIVTPNDDISNYTIVVTGPNGFTSTSFELNDLCAGAYSFTITNEIGETVEGDFEVIEPTAISVNTSLVVDVACFGETTGSIALELQGGTGALDITWNTGDKGAQIVGLKVGTYTASVIDENGCAIEFEYTIEQPTNIVLKSSEVVNSTSTNNPNGSIDIAVEGGTAGYNFLWSNGAVTEDISGLDAGNYTVDVTDAHGCTVTYGPFTVSLLDALNEIDVLNAMTILPNPVSDEMNVRLEFSEYTNANIGLINNLGQVIKSVSLSGTTINWNETVNSYPSGLYFIRVSVGSQSMVKKVIIE